MGVFRGGLRVWESLGVFWGKESSIAFCFHFSRCVFLSLPRLAASGDEAGGTT